MMQEREGKTPMTAKTPIRTKLVWSHICIAFVPFILIGTMGIVFSVREAQKSANQYLNQTVNQISKSIDVYMTDMTKSVNLLGAVIESGQEQKEVLQQQMDQMVKTHDEIAGILYASGDDTYVTSGMRRISRDAFRKELWYQQACKDPGKVHIISSITGRNIVTDAVYATGDVFSLAKAIEDPMTGVIDGVLLLDIRHSVISDAIWDAWISSEGFVFVMDEEDRMVYTPVNDIVYRILPEWLQHEGAPIGVHILGRSYQIQFANSDITGWKVVGVISTEELKGGVYKMIWAYALMFGLTLVLVTVLSRRMAVTITRPVIELRNLMKATEQGDLSVRFRGNGQDEIHQLGHSFNHMLSRIQGLLDQVLLEEEEKRQAQIKIMQEQFKPHFLYNTLDTINWMARESGAHDVVKMVDALTSMFRISLSKGRDCVEIREEIQYISSYLYIQKIRYGKKVTYTVEAEESCLSVVIPKLILQPLVENAIYHGVKLKRAEGHLGVLVREVQGRILLTVEDDGKGMPPEKATELQVMLNSKEKTRQESFGLYYVRERLRLQYGDDYRVTVTSRPEEGCCITIELPAQEGGVYHD